MTEKRGKMFLVIERADQVTEEIKSLASDIKNCLASEINSGEVEVSMVGRRELDILLKSGEEPNSIIFLSGHMATEAKRVSSVYPKMNIVVIAGRIPAGEVAFVPVSIFKAKTLSRVLCV